MFASWSRTVRVVLVGLALLVFGKIIWSHRGDDWVLNLLRPQGPAKTEIKFDNGSVRDAAVAPADQASRAATDSSVKNEAGQLKKCVVAGKVTYTDQVCPVGAKVAAVSGGNVVVLDAQQPKSNDNATAQGKRRTLRDALDLSGGEDIKARMMERAVNR